MSRGQRFVGRATEIATLLGAVRAAASRAGGLALVGGEPGVGKTRLVAEAARLGGAETGAIVLWGRCPDAEGAPAFWPWRQILRDARAHPELGALREVEDLLAPPAGAAETAPEQKRFEVFEKAAAAVAVAAERRPLLLILDDLHWADRSSIKLLQFLAREVRASSVLLLATFREVEPTVARDVANLLGEIVALGHMLPLRGLSPAEVAELIADLAGLQPAADLVRSIHEATQGNPFFVDEVVRLLVAERRLEQGGAGAELPIPLGVRATLARRIEALGEDARRLLAACAAGGREIDLNVMARAANVERGTMLAALEAAEGLGLLSHSRAGSPYAFAHALVREALYEGLRETERSLWHARIGLAIEAVHTHDLEAHLAELAHHFGAAARGGGDARKAVEYGLRAGEAALEQLAFEKAELELGRALRLLELLDQDGVERRCRIVLALAEARRGAGDVEGMTEAFREAVGLARELSPESFADAVIRLATARHESFFVDQLLVGLLEEALARLPPSPGSLRARCLARLGATLHLDPTAEQRRLALTDEAMAMARTLGDRRTLAWVLMMRIIAGLGPDTLEERLALEGEILRIADETGDVVATLEAQAWRVHDLLELGDIAAVRLAIHGFTRLAERLRQPVYLWHAATWRVMQALLEGDLPEAERLLGEALVAGQRAQQQSAILRYGEGLLMLRYEQGRMRELEGLVRMGAEQATGVVAWRIALASMHLQSERPDEARAEVERLAASDFREVPRDANWLFGIVSLAHLVCELDHRAPARVLYDLLLPYAGRMTATRPAVSFSGGVSHFLGRLAALLGDTAGARVHLENALREHRQLGAVAWVARSQVELARLLLESGTEEGRSRGRDLVLDACEVTKRLGLEEIRPRAERLLERVRAGLAAGAPPSPSSSSLATATSGGANALVREGEFWRVVFRGSELRVRDLTGIRQIAHLLGHPGEEISVLDLLDVSGRRPAPSSDSRDGAGAVSLRDAGEVLDRRARAEYREEIASLESELEQARAFNDLGRVRALEAEIGEITGELSRALGLGGRPRRVGAPLERARVSVTRTIRDAIRRLEMLDPRLGRFLGESIHTGRFCCYRPAVDRPEPWRVA